MTLIYIVGFIVMVSIYAIVTNRLNKKPKCKHNWEEIPDGMLKCTKCKRSIQLQNIYQGEELVA